MASRRHRIAATVTSTVAMIGAGLAAVSVPAQAAPSFDACAPAYPLTKTQNGATTSNLTPGQTVTGLTTVDSGAPVQFTGTYVGTIDNGIGDGLDMLVFDLKGPRITGDDGKVAAGNWAGISGSPIYDDATGDLVGSVRTASPTRCRRAQRHPRDVHVRPVGSRLLGLGRRRPETVTATQAESAAIAGPATCPAPSAPGTSCSPPSRSAASCASLANKIAGKSRLLQKSPSLSGGFRAGAGGGGSDVDYPIVPGGSIAMTRLDRHVTTGMVGTVTAVCGDQVYAFGHPGNFTGTSTATFNGAQTVMIQEDGIASPSFKVANIGRVKGVITQDRLQGIVGTLGRPPPGRPGHLDVHRSASRRPKTSSTSVSQQDALPYTVGAAGRRRRGLRSSTSTPRARRFDAGRSATRGRARPASRRSPARSVTPRSRLPRGRLVRRRQRRRVAADQRLREGRRARRVDVSAAYQPTYRAAAPQRVQQRAKGKWRYVGRRGVSAKPGSTVTIRLRLGAADADSTAPTTFTRAIHLKTSKSARGTGRVELTGQAASTDDFEDIDFADLAELLSGEGEEEDRTAPRSLDQPLALLESQPRQDAVVGTFSYKNRYGKIERERTVRTADLSPARSS